MEYEDRFGNEEDIQEQVTPEQRYENWWQKRARIAEEQYQAEQAFFAHNFDLGFMRLAFIPKEYRNERLTCCWCHFEAVYYQMRPGKALFCRQCANKLQRERYKRIPQRVKDKRKVRQKEQELEAIYEEQIQRTLNG